MGFEKEGDTPLWLNLGVGFALRTHRVAEEIEP